jgi:N-acetylneuraminate synthase
MSEKKVFVIAEIGINHNGDMKLAKKLINAADRAGCDAVKFQKRTIDTVYTKEELDKYRESPWGTTNRQQKNGLEFTKEQYDEINEHCKKRGIHWFASAWDVESQHFMRQYDLMYNKVASAMLTHRDLLQAIAEEGKYTFISTGMSTLDQIEKAVKEKFNCNVGYSGHEVGIIVTCAAVALGATSVERHITLDRSMYGSDQAASLEIGGLRRLVEYIREIELSLGDGVKNVTEKEQAIASKLRKVDTI